MKKKTLTPAQGWAIKLPIFFILGTLCFGFLDIIGIWGILILIFICCIIESIVDSHVRKKTKKASSNIDITPIEDTNSKQEQPSQKIDSNCSQSDYIKQRKQKTIKIQIPDFFKRLTHHLFYKIAIVIALVITYLIALGNRYEFCCYEDRSYGNGSIKTDVMIFDKWKKKYYRHLYDLPRHEWQWEH